jgi:hypothetical protein
MVGELSDEIDHLTCVRDRLRNELRRVYRFNRTTMAVCENATDLAIARARAKKGLANAIQLEA